MNVAKPSKHGTQKNLSSDGRGYKTIDPTKQQMAQ
jgi:hypothetical protein